MRFNSILTGVVLTLAVQKALKSEIAVKAKDKADLEKVKGYILVKIENFIFGKDNVATGGLPFDKNNPNWNEDSAFNASFLNSQQNYFNDLLKARGYVFLNQVYEALGFPATQQGAVAGWTKDDTIYFIYGGNIEPLNTGEQDIVLYFNAKDNILDALPKQAAA